MITKEQLRSDLARRIMGSERGQTRVQEEKLRVESVVDANESQFSESRCMGGLFV